MDYPLPEHIVEKVEFPHTLIMLREDRVAEIRCGENTTYDIAEIKENHAVLKKMANGKPLVVLNIAAKYTLITDEARSYLAEGHHKSFIAAEAFLIQSLPQRLLARFYVTLIKPPVPTKYFDYKNKEEAEKWLLCYKEIVT